MAKKSKQNEFTIPQTGGKAGRRRKDIFAHGPVELLEESVYLLRQAPAGLFFIYYMGTAPFIIGLLYFWADMSRSASGYQYNAAASLAMAGLFFWMKYCQSVFTQKLHDHIRGGQTRRFSFLKTIRTLPVQAFVHASGLFILPVALIAAFPFAWVYAFYQNATVLGLEDPKGLKDLCGKSWRQAQIQSKQNNLIIMILFLFGLFIFLNIASAVLLVPQLVKSLLGIETFFTILNVHILNTTFLAAVAGVTFLCIDPIVKGVYTLRCFYGISRRTGEDLRVSLALLKPIGRMAVILALLLTAAALDGGAVQAAQNPAPAGPGSISGGELDKAIKDVMKRREFTWRMPRDKAPEMEKAKGPIGQFLEWTSEKINDSLKAIGDWVRKFRRWMASQKPQPSVKPGSGDSGSGWAAIPKLLLYILSFIVISILILLIVKTVRSAAGGVTVKAEAVADAKPDLTDEDVSADQLPEEGWMALANELMEKGSLRLALRALYLATLSKLSELEIITIAKYKSNRDYELELARRTTSVQEIRELFADNVRLFDRAWYGRYEVMKPDIEYFVRNQEKIMKSLYEFRGNTGLVPG